jgi:hypothetical protein
MEPRDPANRPPSAATLLLRRLGAKLPKKKRPAIQARAKKPLRPSPFSGIAIVNSLLKTTAFLVLLLAYLVVELMVSMLAYAYLNLYQINTFGYLIRLSRNLLTTMQTLFETYAPQYADRAYATLLGEIGPKSILLLFLGLAGSTLIRFLMWIIVKGFEAARSAKPAQTARA